MKVLRVGENLTADTDTTRGPDLQNMLNLAQANGIKLRVGLQPPFAYGDRTDNGQYPAGDANALYQQGYNRVYSFVQQFHGSGIEEWEFGNELNLLAKNASGQQMFGAGWTAAEFAGQSIMTDWSNVLRGMSDAVRDVNAQYGLHMRRVIGTTSTMFGFLDYMTQQGVNFDTIAYHYYEHYGVDPNNYWGGVRPNFNLFQEFATYNKPIVVNETNCAEIYDSNFENQAGQPDTEQCFRSINAILSYFKNQTYAPIEDIDVYEMLDEPSKTTPENHFGLQYDPNTPKVEMYILSKYAGGDAHASRTIPADQPRILTESDSVVLRYPQ